mmetsp:Transcript_108656/g.292207  ORF Transcript_108656/g.292207 Transcript_108656/m.292207 type:complete len:322 (-) Transcript_108656:522-1487(-)
MERLSKLVSTLASKGAPVVAGGAVLAGGGYLAGNAMYTVDAGHMAIKYNRMSGVGSTNYREGIHFAMPWFERPIVFDVRTRPHTMASLTGSKDLQMVNISLRALAKPDPAKLAEIYRYLGLEYDEKVLPSIMNETLKSTVAQYNASELIKQRELVSRQIRQRLVQRASDFGILLDDVSITDLSFSPEYEKAVESKQVAQQQAERARFQVLKAHEEKKRTIINAEGEAKSAEMIGVAMSNNPGFVELRRIEKAKEISGLLGRSANRMVLDTDSLLLSLMDGSHGTAGSGGEHAGSVHFVDTGSSYQEENKGRGWLGWLWGRK